MFLVRFAAPGVGVHIESGAAPAARALCPPVGPQTPAAEAEAAAPAEADVSL